MSARRGSGWDLMPYDDHHKSRQERQEEAATRVFAAQWRSECGHLHTTNGLARCRDARAAS